TDSGKKSELSQYSRTLPVDFLPDVKATRLPARQMLAEVESTCELPNVLVGNRLGVSDSDLSFGGARDEREAGVRARPAHPEPVEGGGRRRPCQPIPRNLGGSWTRSEATTGLPL